MCVSKMVVRSCEMELPSLNAYGSKDLLERENKWKEVSESVWQQAILILSEIKGICRPPNVLILKTKCFI